MGNSFKLKLNITINDLEYNFKEREDLDNIANCLNIEILTILWQMLLKAYQELQQAGNQLIAAEMMVIRLCHLNNIPTPSMLIEKLSSTNSNKAISSNSFALKENIQKNLTRSPSDFEEVAQLFYDKKEMLLYHYLLNDVNLIEFSPNKIRIKQNISVPHNFVNKVSNFLEEWTGEKWQISVSSDNGMPTLSTQAEITQINEISDFSQNQIVKNILDNFPSAKVVSVTKH